MEPTAITVRVPATSANLGAGFDCLGLALDMFASVTVTFSGAEQPPTDDVGEKMVLTAIKQTYLRLGRQAPHGIRSRYNVAIPLGRGLGASAVARVAGVVAVNEYERGPLSEAQMLDIASDLEGHGDNACPALFGGLQVFNVLSGRSSLAAGPIAVRMTIEAVNRGLDVPLADGLAIEAELFGQIASSSDMKEGTAAFLEKRPAKFTGK